MVLAKVSPVNTIIKTRRNRIISLVLSRSSICQEWGFSISGGWLEGQWIGVRQVLRGSPADLAGLEEGDSLVKIEDDLVIFLEPRQVEELLDTTETELQVTVERGHIEPLCVCEETPQTASINMGTKGGQLNKEMVTIVINKEKGVWARK
eukprot:GFUD01071337.1.p1 GENE.GFUD01071337.1~~GFUD01071337.1.p1  ORF type:complete len:160 (-),score=62.49 GFUD01071337.1:203-652(-)